MPSFGFIRGHEAYFQVEEVYSDIHLAEEAIRDPTLKMSNYVHAAVLVPNISYIGTYIIYMCSLVHRTRTQYIFIYTSIHD